MIAAAAEVAPSRRRLTQTGSVTDGSSINENLASGDYATVSGGWRNEARDASTTVGGGGPNVAGNTMAGGQDALCAIVNGGCENLAGSAGAAVAGGRRNIATSSFATIGGGNNNTASGQGAVISGGESSIVSGDRGTVGGGRNNGVDGQVSTVIGERSAP